MDSAAIEALGMKPIVEELNRIEAIKNIQGVQQEIDRLHSLNLNPLSALVQNRIQRIALKSR